MISKVAENQLIKWLFWGGIGVTVLVTSSINYDPVNVSKLVLLSGIGLAILFQILNGGLETLWKEYRPVIFGFVGFFVAGVWAFINADNPKPLAFFGTFGRNTGFLAYLSLAMIFLGSVLLYSRNTFKKVIWSLLIAGWINVVYCLSAALGFDPISWNNIYNRILGTFGNPNFIGAFLGMYFATAIAFIIGNEVTKNQRIALALTLPFAFWEILESKAIQGLVLSVAGTGIVILFAIRSYLKSKLVLALYVAVGLVTGGFALAGALQKGPLTSLIYKTSVSLRGEYWAAGLKMGFDNLWTGVGWDGYGEWFRRERRPSALILPGPQVVTNAAHNVFIDIFAYGGLPLILAYIFLVGLSALAAFRVIRRFSQYDPVFVSLFAAWICYNLQAIISINQIGLAIWGWILGGALISFERSTRVELLSTNENVQSRNAKKLGKARSKDSVQISGYLAGVSGFAIGLLIALPPFLADAQWRSALSSSDVKKVLASANRFPMDSYRTNNIVVLLEQNKFTNEAVELSRKAVKYNPNDFDSWRMLAGISGSTPDEKANAVIMMHKLDPLNTDLK